MRDDSFQVLEQVATYILTLGKWVATETQCISGCSLATACDRTLTHVGAYCQNAHLDACSPPKLCQLCTLGINIRASLQTLLVSCTGGMHAGLL